MANHPKIAFENPPVIETVIGLQFAPLGNFSSAHAGRFWAERLDKDWTKASDAHRLEDAFERFGAELVWGHAGGMFVRTTPGDRVQIVDKNDERMLQIQDTRFIYNWRKRGRDYPSYDELLPKFRSHFSDFHAFASEHKLGELKVNQWEVTYISHLPRGELWQTPNDWPSIVPSLHLLPHTQWNDLEPEDLGAEWHLVIPDRRGRLHVGLRHGKVLNGDGPEVMVFNMTARGPVNVDQGMDWAEGLDLGHSAIVTSFASMVSPTALKHWGAKF
jgi:uncharacterized protein (TIGR04255 family)